MAAAAAKKKQPQRAAAAGGAGRRRRKVPAAEEKSWQKAGSKLNEEISSDSEAESSALGGKRKKDNEAEEEIEETAQEKKLRLAKVYLEQLRQQEEEKAEEEAFEKDLVASRLKEDVLEQKGKLQRPVAKELQPPDTAAIRVLRGHQLPITCLVISPDDKSIFSAAKDCSIIKWDVESGKKLHVIPGGKKGTEAQHVGHTTPVLCMAVSSDGKYLVRAPGCDHGAGQPEPGVLRDSRRARRHRAGLEDPRGVAARVLRAPGLHRLRPADQRGAHGVGRGRRVGGPLGAFEEEAAGDGEAGAWGPRGPGPGAAALGLRRGRPAQQRRRSHRLAQWQHEAVEVRRGVPQVGAALRHPPGRLCQQLEVLQRGGFPGCWDRAGAQVGPLVADQGSQEQHLHHPAEKDGGQPHPAS
ncbi:U3 small nucleolar RNA-interacting protein 2 isoform X4 [Carettochelys insculpta]|uniref:U3 small nucleolar RNA-interacting protein 2 isoform X4 n=1 Tax=Carettochelys insculpta TaxID=44489 RepID=UPI003EB84C14